MTPCTFETLLADLIDGDLDADGRAALTDLLHRDADARMAYLDLMFTHALVRRELQSRTAQTLVRAAAPTPTLPALSNVEGSRASRPSVWYAAALLLIAATITIVFLLPSTPHPAGPAPNSPVSFAVLTDANSAQWADHALIEPGAALPSGAMRLVSGQAQLLFNSGAVVTLRGPIDLDITGPDRAFVHRGQLVAFAPDRAHGFTIDAPGNVSVTDLGTEFGVSVDALGQVRTHVFTGLVQVAAAGQVYRLAAGQGALASSAGLIARESADRAQFYPGSTIAAVPLGALFDDAPGVALIDALATDKPTTSPRSPALGLWRVQTGQMDQPAPIAPGVVFDFASVGGGELSAGPPANQAARAMNGYAITLPSDAPAVHHAGIGMHANAFISFDLEAIRAAGPVTPTRFAATGGLNMSSTDGSIHLIALVCDARRPIAAYVDGRRAAIEEAGGVWRVTDELPEPLTPAHREAAFDVPLDESAAYLVLACTSNGPINSDHGVFAEARLVVDSNLPSHQESR
ncbi:MAG: hypothetical protein GC162_12305 [Planctomycetes bacterium]|nr:hypothetical protein [Planctomycetota bacterium]